jgi:hypothetical protein
VSLRLHLERKSGGPWPDPPEGQKDAVERLRKSTTPAWKVELAAIGRMRAEVASRGQTLPRGTVIGARFDRFGSVLVWPGGSRYRLLPPGTLRNALDDRRADVSPLTSGRLEDKGAGDRLGMRTRLVMARSPIATVELELGTMDEVGLGGPLLCRMVLEIAGMDPSSEVCQPREVLLHAAISWTNAAQPSPGGLVIEVDELTTATELAHERLSVPPSRARFMSSGLPGSSRVVFVSSSELEKLEREAAEGATTPDSPPQGMVADNQSDRLLLVLLDGIVIASVPPWQSLAVPRLPNGRYSLQWQAFLGESTAPAKPVTAPLRTVYGAAPSEKPDAG